MSRQLVCDNLRCSRTAMILDMADDRTWLEISWQDGMKNLNVCSVACARLVLDEQVTDALLQMRDNPSPGDDGGELIP